MARKFDLPDEFDLQVYRANNSDIQYMSDAELIIHFNNHGINEGRVCSSASTRRGFLAAIPQDKNCLELGPFCNPLLTRDNVKYFDVLDQNSLRERARFIGISDEKCPCIDFVSPVGDLSIVQETFDVVFSSHTVEHQPDLVKHLRDVCDCLNFGGRYMMIIPDKRFCFDHFICPSTIADVLAAYSEQRKTHTAKSFFEHRVLLTHNDPVRHWNGDNFDPALLQTRERIFSASKEWAERDDRYIDVHAWQFTPDSFRNIIEILNEVGLITLKLEKLYPTVRGGIEFYAALRSGNS